MNREKADIYIKKIASPNTTATSTAMLISSIAKISLDDVDYIVASACEADIFKIASAASILSDELKQYCEKIILQKLSAKCKNNSQITVLDLLAVLEYDEQTLFNDIVEKLSENMIIEAFSIATSKNACRFMRMYCENRENKFFNLCKTQFCDFLNRYDTSADAELTLLLPFVLQNDCIVVASKLISVLGSERLRELYEGDFDSEIKNMLVSNCQSIEIWDAFLNGFFAVPHTNEEILYDGLWFVQLNVNENLESLILMAFFLYLAKNYTFKHPIFEYVGSVEVPTIVYKKYMRMLEEQLRNLWGEPEELLGFLKIFEVCNPFSEEMISHGRELLINNDRAESSDDYYLLEQLFVLGADSEAIVYIFFNTFLKLQLKIEDMFHLAHKYGIYEELIEVVRQMVFTGTIDKYHVSALVISPESYYTLSHHSMIVHHSRLEYIMKINGINKGEQLKNQKIEYYIYSCVDNRLRIGLYVPQKEKEELEYDPQVWIDSVNKLDKQLENAVAMKNILKNQSQSSDFSCELFADKYDFSLFTDLILKHIDKLEQILQLLSVVKWNIMFQMDDISLPSRYYCDFAKYKDAAISLFKKLFEAEYSINLIFDLYFKSIYKAIVPFHEFILMTDKEKMLEALQEKIIYCKLLDGERRHKCRLMNINCAPVCVFLNSDLLEDGRRVPSRCVNYKIYDGVLGRIFFVDASKEILSPDARGELFGYITKNLPLNRIKLERIALLPDAENLDMREMKFNLELMALAINFRRNSGEEMLKLIRAFGTKNPYDFQQNTRIDVLYLLRCYPECNEKELKNQAIQLVLNTDSAKEMAEIYFNSNLKYHIDLQRFAAMVSDRKIELQSQLQSMLEDYEFECGVDKDGYLLSYLLPQYSVNVGRQYALKTVKCKFEIDGNLISAEVLSAEDGIGILDTVLICGMSGYNTTDILPHLQGFLKQYGKFDDGQITEMTVGDNSKNAFIKKLSVEIMKSAPITEELQIAIGKAEKNQSRILKMLDNENADLDEYKQSILRWLEKSKDTVPIYDIEKMVTDITERFMSYTNNAEQSVQLLWSIFADYSYYYRDNDIVASWCEQLTKHFGTSVADGFLNSMKQNRRYIRNQ